MKFLKNSKGFTLAEMLIVMAVVVVLAAAATPAIGNQVESARESNDLAAIREAYIDAYAQAATQFAAVGKLDTTTGVIKITGIPSSQKQAGWTGLKTPKIADVAVDEDCAVAADTVDINFTFTGDSTADSPTSLTLTTIKKASA